MTSEEFQALLLKKRTELGYSQQDVVKLSEANISRQHYSLIENGDRRPSVEVAKKIGALLGLKWTLFFEAEGNQKLQKRSVV